MSELFSQLGVDWKLLVSQAVNFGILLIALTFLVYKPLIRIIEERRSKIEFGLESASKAENRLSEIEKERILRLAEADKEAVLVISKAKSEAERRKLAMMSEADAKAKAVIEEGLKILEQKKSEEFEKFVNNAGVLFRGALAKAIAQDPASIDEKMIRNAERILKEKKII